MKKLLLLFVLFVSATIYGQDMQQYLSETNTMVKEKKYKEALERYIWFQDHALEHDMGMNGVRGSFALSSWKSLAEVYPPALTAMVAMRDQKAKNVLDSNNASSLFGDVVALNRTLNEEYKTIPLFESLSQKHPEQASRYWIYAKDAVFQAKRYDIAKTYIKSAINEFAVVKANYELTKAMQANNSANANLQKLLQKRFVDKVLELIDFSTAVNDLKSAKEIRDKAIAVADDERLREIKLI